MRKLIVPLVLSALASTMVVAQTSVRVEKLDLEALKKIRIEGMEKSKVMETAFYLTDVNGPRLTNSPGYKRAADWAVQQLKKWGVDNAHLESWGDFGKSWELQKVYVAMTAPYYKPIMAFPKAWTKGTNGLQHSEILMIDPKDSLNRAAHLCLAAWKALADKRTFDGLAPPAEKPEPISGRVVEIALLDRQLTGPVHYRKLDFPDGK